MFYVKDHYGGIFQISFTPLFCHPFEYIPFFSKCHPCLSFTELHVNNSLKQGKSEKQAQITWRRANTPLGKISPAVFATFSLKKFLLERPIPLLIKVKRPYGVDGFSLQQPLKEKEEERSIRRRLLLLQRRRKGQSPSRE